MHEKETVKTDPDVPESRDTAHPWVDLPVEDDSLGEAVRYSLDEIRFT